MCAKESFKYVGPSFPMKRQGAFRKLERVADAKGKTIMIVVLDKIFYTVEKHPEITDPKILCLFSRVSEATFRRGINNFDKVNGTYIAKKPTQ